MIYDVAIVGAGSAGIAAAKACALAGLRTVVFSYDRKSFGSTDISHSLHPGCRTLLEGLGLGSIVEESIFSEFQGIIVNSEFQPFSEDLSWKGVHVGKSHFDSAILLNLKESTDVDYVKEKICRVHDHVTHIELLTSSSSFSSKYVIDCSGRSRYFGKYFNLEEVRYSKPLIALTGSEPSIGIESNTPSLTFGKEGWHWIAPDQSESRTWTKLFIHTRGVRSSDLEIQARNNSTSAFNMTWRIFRPVVGSNFLLCGDAAGILDPSSGQGVFSALIAGTNAGNCIKNILEEPSAAAFHLAMYDKWYFNNFRDKVDLLSRYCSDYSLDIMI